MSRVYDLAYQIAGKYNVANVQVIAGIICD
jgi:hypothetical protein